MTTLHLSSSPASCSHLCLCNAWLGMAVAISPCKFIEPWNWFWCPVTAIYNFSCPSLTEYLCREKGAPYFTRELKNSEKRGHFPDCTSVDDTDVVMAWNIPDFRVSDIKAETFSIHSQVKRKRGI